MAKCTSSLPEPVVIQGPPVFTVELSKDELLWVINALVVAGYSPYGHLRATLQKGLDSAKGVTPQVLK